eukprot:TRINITY_DN528_c2_g1_i1.p1 TRINITY_DN528_c2_g1~~TRINITY_DN528_c2_g1_i1.p1  ORF type:complete len:576 (-),score=187.05 TRINITY_DN528_c2_g1_i1:220-1947(-)
MFLGVNVRSRVFLPGAEGPGARGQQGGLRQEMQRRENQDQEQQRRQQQERQFQEQQQQQELHQREQQQQKQQEEQLQQQQQQQQPRQQQIEELQHWLQLPPPPPLPPPPSYQQRQQQQQQQLQQQSQQQQQQQAQHEQQQSQQPQQQEQQQQQENQLREQQQQRRRRRQQQESEEEPQQRQQRLSLSVPSSQQLQPKPKDLLLAIANNIAAGNLPKARQQMQELARVASVFGSATQRLSAYFLEGLAIRVSGGSPAESDRPMPNVFTGSNCARDLMRSFEVLVNASPYLTFGHVACNSAILEAFKGEERVHIVDFGMGCGLQWHALFQALAVRPGGPPRVHFTGIDVDTPPGTTRALCIVQAGAKLANTCRECCVPFEYEPVHIKLEDMKPHHVNIRPGEVLAVNCALRLHRLLDETVTPSNPRNAVLRTIGALKPRLLTLVEQNTNHNSPFFLSRFYEALHYYTTMFEELESVLPEDSQERHTYEQQVLGKAIVNVVACEGQERVERQEPLGRWQQRVQREGFRPFALSALVVQTVRGLLNTYRDGYTVIRPDDCSLVLNWRERPLMAMSAWTR